MSNNLFIPNIGGGQTESAQEPEVVLRNEKADSISQLFLKVAQYSVVAVLGLVAVFFTPGLYASLNFDKTLLVIVFGVIVVTSLSFVSLRTSRVQTVVPLTLIVFWLFVASALLSGLFSGDSMDSLRGSVMETQTVSFLAVMGLAMAIPLVLQRSKLMSIKALTFFAVTAGILLFYNLLRILFGADWLALGSFGSATVSPVGSFNDLALFSAIVVVLGLVTLVQLPLKTWMQVVISALMMMSLTILSVVNFFNVWIVVGFFGLLLFLYLISRDTLFQSFDDKPVTVSKLAILMTAVVCIFSAVFVVAGDYVGSKIGEWTQINYVEVRPSFSATTEVAREVYGDNLLLGAGANRFADAWRMYKDRNINETIFWDTDFSAGSGFVPTLFVNLGILGGVLLILSHLAYLRLGYRMLLRSGATDPYWYYFGLVSFTAAAFVWGMSYVYVPGTGILLLGALFTGCSFAAAGALLPSGVKTIPLTISRRRGFLLMALTVGVISLSVTTLFSTGKQYVAASGFVKAQLVSADTNELDQALAESYNLYPDDRFLSARAQLRLGEMNSLLGVQDPTEGEQQRLLLAAEQGLVLAEQAALRDETNPDHHALLAGMFSALATAGIEGAAERAQASLERGQELDPQNPGYYLLGAQILARAGKVEEARDSIQTALQLKRNYTPALLLLAQLDIATGNTETAIATTQAIITLEPNNPTRYYQLGILLISEQRLEEAVGVFSQALRLDSEYANARYMRALALLDLGEKDLALSDLRMVEETNQDNLQLRALIAQVEANEFVAPGVDQIEPVDEPSLEENNEDAGITSDDVSSDLVNPVNIVPETEELSEDNFETTAGTE
tara:strand:- start:2536 stop:5070 length:2535 start_codon:yes stop_codon:yes gene_type:complete